MGCRLTCYLLLKTPHCLARCPDLFCNFLLSELFLAKDVLEKHLLSKVQNITWQLLCGKQQAVHCMRP